MQEDHEGFLLAEYKISVSRICEKSIVRAQQHLQEGWAGALWLLVWGLLWNNVIPVVSPSGIRHIRKLLSRTGGFMLLEGSG